MRALIVGGTGATGRLLVRQLLDREWEVRVIVRSPEGLPEQLRNDPRLSVVHADLLSLSDAELANHVEGCVAVGSCLGHSLTFSGLFGQPRRLVTEATRRLCQALSAKTQVGPGKFVLMNTTGNHIRDLDPPPSRAEAMVLGILRVILPPQADNEAASAYLSTAFGPNHNLVEWVVVRPDTLIDAEASTEIVVHPSPTRSPIFHAGKISRINVACFMADLITEEALWKTWKGRYPVIYNREDS